MAGITSLLSVAKQGILAQQVALHVTGNNVANVNTSGYSRQSASLSSLYPTPSTVGPIGNGVNVSGIERKYDRFINTTLFDKTSVMGGLETRQSGMKLIEGVLNEVEENGLNELVSQFWTAWEDVANNAEGMAERTTLLQRASLLVSGLRDRYDQLVKLATDVDLNIQTAVDDINQLVRQIAEINVQIVSMEASGPANDLRDQRDELIKRLSEIADVRYFETKRGSYTVLIGQGSPLVEDNRSWSLKMRSGDVYWVDSSGEATEITQEDVSNGKLGGLLDIKARISPPDRSLLTASVANTTGGQGVKASTLWDVVDGVTITGPFNISFSGTDRLGQPVRAIYDSTVDVDGDGTAGQIADFLALVEGSYGGDVDATLDPDGRLVLRDINPGTFPLSFQIEGITGGVAGLSLGRLDGSYPENYLERLNTISSELVRAVNEVHSQGVGLVPFRETTANNVTSNTGEPVSYRSSGLPFTDRVRDGLVEIWLYDSDGHVIDAEPSTTGVNEPWRLTITAGVTTLQDIQDAINNPVTGIAGVTASMPDGRLVFAVDGRSTVAGFAFGRDTSGVMTALGLNTFFTGYDATTIGIDQDLVTDPRLIAAARVEDAGNRDLTSTLQVADPTRPIGIEVHDGTLVIDIYDSGGLLHHTEMVAIDADVTTLDAVMDAINEKSGLSAHVDAGLFIITSTQPGWTINISDNTDLLAFLGVTPPGSPQGSISGTYLVERTFEPLDSHATGVVAGSFHIDLLGEDGTPISSTAVNITPATQNLDDIAAEVDAVAGISAHVVEGRLRITADGGGVIVLRDDTTGILSWLGVETDTGGTMNPANNINAMALSDISREGRERLDGSTISGSYRELVATVGIQSRGVQLDFEFTQAAVAELQARRDEVSGVSLDEELANLLKFQQAYTAAAKLIKAADEMFLSLIETK